MEVSWRNKSAKACREDERARVAMNAKQERIKRVYLLLIGNDNRFLRLFLYLSMYQSRHEHRETENRQKLSLK